jgi:hypothetical protein
MNKKTEKTAERRKQEAKDRMFLLLDVLQHTRTNNPSYFTDGEHFALHMERVAWFRAIEAIDNALHNRMSAHPVKGIKIEDIEPGYRIADELEKKVQHIVQWIELKKAVNN